MDKKKKKIWLPDELPDPKMPLIHGELPNDQAERYRTTGPIPYPDPWIGTRDFPPFRG